MSSSRSSGSLKKKDQSELPTEKNVAPPVAYGFDRPLKGIIIPLLCGIVFGFAFQQAKVHEFYLIRGQFVFRHFVMLKMFFAACGTSVLAVQILSMISSTSAKVQVASETISTKLGRGLLSLISGAVILGMGMGIGGSCPGTVYAQLGSGSFYAPLVLLGGLLGAALYAYCDSLSFWSGFLATWPLKRGLTLPRKFGVSRAAVAFPFGAAMLAGSFTLEFLVPFDEDLKSAPSTFNFTPTIPPSVSGILVGLLQFPLLSLCGCHLGSASSFVIWIRSLIGRSSNKYLNAHTFFWQNWMMLGIVLGAAVSALVTGVSYQSDTFTSYERAVLSGFLLVFGARLANGCTSGHGISGLGHLSTPSLIAVAAMFGSAILTGILTF